MQPGIFHPSRRDTFEKRERSSHAPSPAAWRRRGTIMVFVLGILMLVALVGLVLIARTHGESKRVAFESTSSAKQAATDGVISSIRETLRRDIWGTDPNENYPLRGPSQTIDNPQETNEPYDAPGPSDRWLASSAPYLVGTIQPDPSDPLTLEEDVLAYHRVSYLGSDLLWPKTGASPYVWADNARTPTVPNDYTLYDDENLQGVQILQTPPPIYAGIPLIPGSTTNRTIAQARAVWESSAHQIGLATVLPGRRHQFPYFDTNADGELDLYDADGDGIPDSPISLVIPVNTADPDEPKALYASIKVIDHSAMLNVNVTSSIERPGGAGLMFNEGNPDTQRRGRHLTELLLENVVHASDWPINQRTTSTVANRSSVAVLPADHPLSFDQDIVRRQLVGGIPTGLNYALFGSSDEASLRHRGHLAPLNLGDFNKTAVPSLDNYRTIDKALRWTLLWNRNVALVAPYEYDAGYSRWNRLHSGYEPKGSTTTYEGYDDAFGKGWRSLLQQDQPFAIRRSMLTTVNLAVEPAPTGLEFERDWITDDPTFDRVTLSSVPDVPVGETRLTALPRRNDATHQVFLDGVGTLAMSWPVINRNIIPDNGSIAEWLRVLPIDLNMTANDAVDAPLMKAAFIEHVAAAMYLALDGVASYQGIPLQTTYHTVVATNPAPTPTMRELNREYLAWQFAINLADYRDEDDVPTALQWPFGSGRYIFGIEKQPFFTEAYAYLVAGTGPQSGPSGESHPQVEDSWFTAVELYIPPGWNIPTANLYFRMPNADPDPGFMPIHSFLPVGTAPSLVAGSLSGGSANVLFAGDPDHGNYWVFCNATTNAPASVLADATFLASAYQNPAFNIARNGRGRVELWYSPNGIPGDPRNHILDMIGPEQSGGDLADDTNSGEGIWATRPLGILPGSAKEHSLLRSTKGWRFTTAWQVHSHQPKPMSSPNDRYLRRSLGSPNDTIDSLDRSVPESIWPARVNQINQTPTGGFYSGQPFEAFDSVAELSRMFMIGSLNRPPSLAPQLIPGSSNQPATVFLAEIINQGPTGDFPFGGHTEDRIAAGRVDFVDAKRKARHPWTERLLTYFTTRSPLHDGVDNDGDDPGDGSLTDWNDPTEGISTLYRQAGRININTAPQTVLRTVPFMSLLPTSPEYMYHVGPAVDPAAVFSASPNFFWDFPTAIVAAREDRGVALRLVDAAGVMQPKAVAQRMGPTDANAPAAIGAFTSVGELARLSHLYETTSNNHSLFDVQRFAANTTLALANHKIVGSFNPGPNLGDDLALSPFSPDFRYRGDNGEMNYIPIMLPATAPIGQSVSDPTEAAGIRGRDIFLTRWTNLLTTRSDCFTVYIAMLDEHGNYVSRAQVTLDRSVCFAEVPSQGSEPRKRVLPTILHRSDSSYADDTR